MGFARRFGLGLLTLVLLADPVASWFIARRLVGGSLGDTAAVAVAWGLLDIIVGAWVIRWGGYLGVAASARALGKGQAVEDSLVGGLLNMLAGLLLLWPGILSDVLAVLLVLPPIRWLLRRAIRARAVVAPGPPGVPPSPPGVVEVDDYRVE